MTQNYPSNLTWEQWELISELFSEAKPGGRPRTTTCMYPVVNGILYLLCQGSTWRVLPGDLPPCSTWRVLPGDLPPCSTVYGYFTRSHTDRSWLQVHDKLYQWVRVGASREPSP
ncbi:Mobile element protein [Richelia intracellularis]|nr:Mobile element protein [Richelia intracellularis]